MASPDVITAVGEGKTVDLSVDVRSSLIRRARDAFAAGEPAHAAVLLAAAIRKARRCRLHDIEAEYLRFIALYLLGDYDEAVRRCVTSLETLREIERDAATWSLAASTARRIRDVLEEALLHSMARRGDGVLALVRHLRRPEAGVRYADKRSVPLREAVRRAWVASRTPFPHGVTSLNAEFAPLANVLERRYEEGAERTAVSAPSAPSSSARTSPPPTEGRRGAFGPREEAEAVRFIDDIVVKEWLDISPVRLERVLEIAERTCREETLDRLARLFATGREREAKRLLAALRRNGAVREAVRQGGLAGVRPELTHLLHLAFGRISAGEAASS